jgi:hypothetical protein
MLGKYVSEFLPQVILIGPDLLYPVLKIGLEDTIRAVQGTILTNMNNPVSTTPVIPGSGTKTKEPALVGLEIENRSVRFIVTKLLSGWENMPWDPRQPLSYSDGQRSVLDLFIDHDVL